MSSRYRVLSQIDHEIKVFNWLFLKDAAFVFVYNVIFFMLKGFVNSKVAFYFYSFNFIMSIYLCLPSIRNRGRRNFEMLILAFRADSKVYESVSKRGEIYDK